MQNRGGYNDYIRYQQKTQHNAVTPDLASAAEEIVNSNASNLEAAVIYAKNGVPVFPCKPNKRPLTQHGFHDASTDIERITKFWSRNPTALIGVPTGEISGVFVIDIDGAKGWETYRGKLFGGVPKTLWTRTGGGGAHILLAYPYGVELRNTASQIGPCVDTRGNGGYIIVPPSVTANAYAYQNPGAKLAIMPDMLITACKPHEQEEPRETFKAEPGEITDERLAAWYSSVISGECRDIERTPEGGRNSRLFCAAGRCGQVAIRCGLTADAPGRELLSAARRAGLEQREAAITIWSGFKEAVKRGPAPDPQERERRRP